MRYKVHYQRLKIVDIHRQLLRLNLEVHPELVKTLLNVDRAALVNVLQLAHWALNFINLHQVLDRKLVRHHFFSWLFSRIALEMELGSEPRDHLELLVYLKGIQIKLLCNQLLILLQSLHNMNVIFVHL